MIRILRSTKTDVLFEISTDIFDATAGEGRVTLLFRYETDSKLAMVLLRDRLAAQLEKVMQELREVEYLRGYRDGRAKRGKKNYFRHDLGMTRYIE